MSVRHPDSPTPPPAPGSRSPKWVGQSLAAWPALLIGAGAGLILGLILGWVVWPVQWVSAWPGDLNAETRAHYIATVAEAYTYFADDRAAEIAQMRLYDLNNNLAEEIAAAQAYFNDNPQRESRTYIVNMGRLAQALNVQSPDILTDAPDPQAAVDAPPAVVGPSLIDWLNWAFVAIAALVLIGGGVYIIYERSKRRRAQEEDVIFSELEEEEVGGFEADDWDSDEEETDSAVYRRPLPVPPLRVNAPPEGDVYFEDDDDENEGDVGLDNRFDDDTDAVYRSADKDDASPIRPTATRPQTLPELDYGDADPSPPRAQRPPSTALAAADRKPAPTPAAKSAAKARPAKSAAPPARTQPAAPERSSAPAAATSFDEMTVLGEYTVQYLAGLADYDEPQDIIDPVTGNIIGECGMGVNMKNGYLQNNPEHVIALDVYLFDKRDDERFLSQNRILFCDYVVENKLEHSFSKERPNDPEPLVARPRTKFQLTNSTLVMDCEILEVDFVSEGDAKGIFQNLKLHMQVRALSD